MTENDRQNWEALCRRCGQCCFEKSVDKDGKILTTSVPCRFLDIHSRRCRIYDERTEAEFDCLRLSPELVPTLSWLPDNCAYVEFLRNDD